MSETGWMVVDPNAIANTGAKVPNSHSFPARTSVGRSADFNSRLQHRLGGPQRVRDIASHWYEEGLDHRLIWHALVNDLPPMLDSLQLWNDASSSPDPATGLSSSSPNRAS